MTGLEVELDPRSWGPNYLQLGVEYSSAADPDALFGLAASYLSTAINELGGEWRATFFVGDEPALGRRPVSAVRRERLVFHRSRAQSRVGARSTSTRAMSSSPRCSVREAHARDRRRSRARRAGARYRVGLRARGREVRTARRRSDSCVSDEDFQRGEISSPLHGRYDGQRRVSARGSSASARVARLAPTTGSRPTRTSISCCVARDVREDLGPTHAALDAALRRDDQRRSAGQPAVPVRRLLRSLGPQPQSALGPARDAYRRGLLPAHRRPRVVSRVRGREHRARQRLGLAQRHLVVRQHPRRLVLGRRRVRRLGRSTSATAAPKAARTRSTSRSVAIF